MAYGRVYTMAFSNVSVSLAQDMLALYTGVKAIEIHEIVASQITSAVIGNLRCRLVMLPATVTPGSVGAVGTINPVNPNDVAATVTGRTNDTTQATTSGTARTLQADIINVLNGYSHLPFEVDRFIIPPSSAFIFSLDTAPSSAQVWNGTIKFAELF